MLYHSQKVPITISLERNQIEKYIYCSNHHCGSKISKYVCVYIHIYIYIYIYGEGDTALEAEAQLYSEYSIDLKIMQVKGCK